MTYGELTRKLRRLGIEFYRQGSTHEIWWDPRTGRVAQIPRHKREVATGTVRGVVVRLGLSMDDFQGA